VAVSLCLSGCAGQASDYGHEIADRLQTEVLEVSQLAAATDYAGAIVSLDELEARLKDARARGDVTDARYESVTAALALVRADLQAAIDAQAPVVTEVPAPPDVDNGGDDSNEGKGDNGKGKGKGKGND
jgi:hypothetical protein